MAAPAPAGATSTRARLLTAAVLLPLFIATIILGRWIFLGAVLLLTVAAALEFYGLAAGKPYRARVGPGVALAAAIPVFFYAAPGHVAATLTALVVAGVIGVATAQMLDPDGEEAIASVGFTLLGALYVGGLLGHMTLVRELDRVIPGAPGWLGAALLLVPLVLTWVNDSAAYFAGHRWGRRRLLPRVSPGKSLEGAVAAAAVTVVASVGVCAAVDALSPTLFGLGHALAIGLLVAVAAPCGDLVESAFKRDAGVKDASQAVPGHGGVLDRFDAVLFTVPLFYYYLAAWVV